MENLNRMYSPRCKIMTTKKIFLFLFLVAISVAYGQDDRVFMFVKTTEPTDTVYMTRDDIDSIMVERNCLLMSSSWIAKRDRMEQWNAPNRLNKNETFDVYFRNHHQWEPIMTKSYRSSFLFDKEIEVDSCSSFNKNIIHYRGLVLEDAREQIRQMVESGKKSSILLYGRSIINDLIELLDDATDTHISMPNSNATYHYGDIALMSLLRIVRLPITQWLPVEKESLYAYLHSHPKARRIIQKKACGLCRKDTADFSRYVSIPQFFPVNDSTYQPDVAGDMFDFHHPAKYDYFTITRLGTEWPVAALANSEVTTPTPKTIPSLYMDVLLPYELGFDDAVLTYIALYEGAFGVVSKYGNVSPGQPLPQGYSLKKVKHVDGWGYYLPLGKDWYAFFDEYPKEGTVVKSLFLYRFE